MRVVVTGGGGFIGSHVAHALNARGADVTTADIKYPEIRREWWQCARNMSYDLRVKDNARLAIEGADYVYHFAADMGGVGYFHSDKDPKAAATNMRIDLNVLDACQHYSVPFFYASSACAYPTRPTYLGLLEHDLREDMLGGGPADAMYGEEKRFMAMLLAHEPLARVGIFHTIYGPGQEWDGQRAKFPPAICRKVKEAARPLVGDGFTDNTPMLSPIEIWGDGSQTRTFLYIDDAVEKITAIAEAPDYAGPVNVGSDEVVTVKQCADWLCEHAGIEPNYRFDTSKPVGVVDRGCDNTLYNQRYGRPSQTTAREGLGRLFEWLP